MANQFSNRPPFCDYLERYQAVYKPKWKISQLRTQRVGIGRFDEWLKICGLPMQELNWQKLMEFHKFLAAQGVSPSGCRRGVQTAKHALRWGIETGELPQKMEDIYTFHYSRHDWPIELPPLSQEFLNELEPARPGAFRSHRYAHKIFHTYLAEKKLTYRQLKINHFIVFVKYLGDKKLVQRTRMHVSVQVRAYLRWLYRRRKISRPIDDIFPLHLVPKKQLSLPRPLEPEVDQKIQEILESADDLYYMGILLLRRTGLRITELRKLEFDCIQTDPKGRSALKVPPIKLGLERRVPLDSQTIALIKRIQEMSVNNFKRKKPPKYLIISNNGRPPRYERFSEVMEELCARIGVKKWINLHSLRHTYATAMLNAGLSITSLKEILGHKTIIMSLGYAKVSQEKIHAEYSSALLKMSAKQIPQIMAPSPGGPNAAFSELGNFISKALDDSTKPDKQKRLKALRAKLAKLKMEYLKAL